MHKLNDILAKLDEVAAELEKDMEGDGWTGRTITLKYKLDTYQGVPTPFATYPEAHIDSNSSLYPSQIDGSLGFEKGGAIQCEASI